MKARSIGMAPGTGEMTDGSTDRSRGPIPRVHRIAVRVAASAMFLAVALFPPPARAQTTASDSTATNLAAWIFSTSSGWNDEEKLYVGTPPVGTWKEQYKHWFTPAQTKPTTWTTAGSPAKPNAAAWASTPSIKNTFTTTSVNGSTATSNWYINTYESAVPIRKGWNFYADYETKSQANATGADATANADTRIRDPWVFTNPANNPNWNSSIQPLDPQGHWQVAGQLSLWGLLQEKPGSSGTLTDGMAITLNSTSPQSLTPLLDISIGSSKTTVTAGADDLVYKNGLPYYAFDVGSKQYLYFFTDSAGNQVTTEQMTKDIDKYRTPTGWSLSPDLSLASFVPDASSSLSQVLTFQAYVLLDSSVSTAAMYNEVESDAVGVASVPEPMSALLLAIGLAGAWWGLGGRRRNRAGSRKGPSSRAGGDGLEDEGSA